jgi:hypothetical protein
MVCILQDTVKKRLQAQVLTHSLTVPIKALRYEGFLHCFETIHAEEGFRGFYRVILTSRRLWCWLIVWCALLVVV